MMKCARQAFLRCLPHHLKPETVDCVILMRQRDVFFYFLKDACIYYRSNVPVTSTSASAAGLFSGVLTKVTRTKRPRAPCSAEIV